MFSVFKSWSQQQWMQRGAITGLVFALIFFSFSYFYIPTQADQSAVPLLRLEDSFVIEESESSPQLGTNTRFVYDVLDEQRDIRESTTTTQVYTCAYTGGRPRVYTAKYPSSFVATLPYTIDSGVGAGTNFANDCKLTLKATPSSQTSLVITDVYESFPKFFNEFTEPLSDYDLLETDLINRQTHLVKFNSADQIPRIFSNNPQVDYFFLTDSFEPNGADCPLPDDAPDDTLQPEACFEPDVRLGASSIFVNCITSKDNPNYMSECSNLLDNLELEIS
jgi:hypothetical protein